MRGLLNDGVDRIVELEGVALRVMSWHASSDGFPIPSYSITVQTEPLTSEQAQHVDSLVGTRAVSTIFRTQFAAVHGESRFIGRCGDHIHLEFMEVQWGSRNSNAPPIAG